MSKDGVEKKEVLVCDLSFGHLVLSSLVASYIYTKVTH